MVIMSGPQSIISHEYEPNGFLEVNSLSGHTLCGLGTYNFDEVFSLPISFTQDTLFL